MSLVTVPRGERVRQSVDLSGVVELVEGSVRWV